DPGTGLATINWIAEITVDNSSGWTNGDWNKKVAIEEFIHHFEGWNYEWLDVPAMLRGAAEVFEYPMIDRDPVPSWVDGNVALLGDAAHVMYPTGSNGATQAIMDARVLGAGMIEHGVTARALQAYDAALCEEISAVVLRNRGAGPFGLLNLLDERCGSVFDDIDAVIPPAEREEFMSRYKAAAGFAMERLNSSPPIIAPGARVGRGGAHAEALRPAALSPGHERGARRGVLRADARPARLDRRDREPRDRPRRAARRTQLGPDLDHGVRLRRRLARVSAAPGAPGRDGLQRSVRGGRRVRRFHGSRLVRHDRLIEQRRELRPQREIASEELRAVDRHEVFLGVDQHVRGS